MSTKIPTVPQSKILDKMDPGQEYSAYNLRCSLATMDALTHKGFIHQTNPGAFGTMGNPRCYRLFKKMEVK